MSETTAPVRQRWRWVKFECRADPGSEVFIAGTFNNWTVSASHKLRDGSHDGHFGTLLNLRKGRYEYKFLVNGEWRAQTDDSTRNIVVDVG